MAFISQIKLSDTTYDISAIKLKNAKTIQTNLASASAASFDGTANVTPGVTGVLGIGNGGTGASTAPQARTNLGLNQVKIYYEINLSSYSTNNFYFIDFGCSDIELDCEIHSNNLGGDEPYNQNVIHFLMIHNGWSDTPKSFTVLSQGCYTSTELTIMSIVSGTQNGLRGVYVRGGLTYRIISNQVPTLNLTTKTLNNESYASGTTSYTTITNANTIWTNNGTNRASWSIPLYGAVWNDYAEFRICNEDFKPGQVVLENGDDALSIANQRLQRGCSIVSDTFGFAIGETDEAKCPIAVSGRVLAYGHESREEFKKHIGWPVCSGPNGTVSIMTGEEEEKYPSRIIGTISAVPDYETWGTGNVEVNNRIWIKIK